MARPSVAIRLGVEGKEQVKSDFADIGKSGSDAAQRWGAEFDRQSALAEKAIERAARAADRVAAASTATPVQARINEVTGVGASSSARDSAAFFAEMETRARAAGGYRSARGGPEAL
jgi:hypothetical protein